MHGVVLAVEEGAEEGAEGDAAGDVGAALKGFSLGHFGLQ